MFRLVLRGMLLRRDAYLRMVLASEGVADGLMIVAAVHLLLAVPRVLAGAGVLALLWGVLGGLFGWVVLSLLIYLAARYLLRGEGSFPGTAAAVSLAFPPLLLALALRWVLDPFPALLAASAWSVACLWQGARVALELSPLQAALAVAAGYGGWVLLSSVSSW